MSSKYTANRPLVAIIGAGFAGINAAKELCEKEVDVVVIDKQNHHLFQPLLYQVATAGLSPADIAAPIRSVLHRCENIKVIWGAVEKIDIEKKVLHIEGAYDQRFDYLILASGASHSYFSHPEWQKHAPGLKTIEDAISIRKKVLSAFERAEISTDAHERKALLTFVIVGAGPTGVEMAGAIAELARFALKKDFRNINTRATRVLLIEAGPRILPSFSEALSQRSQTALKKMGVEVILGRAVTDITETYVSVGSENIPCASVIWAAGVAASKLGADLGSETDRQGRVLVQNDLSVKNFPNIFVCGDLAHIDLGQGKSVPGMAPGAIQSGKHAAKNILRLTQGQPTLPFRYFDKGSLATVGRSFAIAEVGTLKFSGWIARILWTFVHIVYLISFRNRVMVMVQWTWAFFTFKRGTRLIV